MFIDTEATLIDEQQHSSSSIGHEHVLQNECDGLSRMQEVMNEVRQPTHANK
jgi:hypothetical protein